jgi:hypothetical protein
MATMRPGIDLAGYKKALKEYGEGPTRIIEELVANSYDADATVVFIVHSTRELIVIDNGRGIADDQFPRLLELGAGTKIGSHESELGRSYLGAFGFGIKATVNISKTITFITANKSQSLRCEVDVAELESKGFKRDWPGFPITTVARPQSVSRGTVVWLKLKNELTADDIEAIKTSLYNIPKAKNFAVHVVPAKKAGKTFTHPSDHSLKPLSTSAIRFKAYRVKGTLDIGSPRLTKVKLGADSIDVAVWCRGLDENMKVPSLGQFAGVYVKVDGRVIKRNFQGEKVLDGISKFPKFKHGMRIEAAIDWVKDQISLGRDGLQFANESSKRKFEGELKMAVSSVVRPFAKQLEDRKLRKASKETGIRLRRAKDRINKKQSIKKLEGTGYSFVPGDDYEMALLLANPVVLKKLSPTWVLMDFNGQLDFDCLVYDKATTNFVKLELEPKLDSFISQAVPDNTDAIVTWTKGDWKVGKKKRGKRGYYELVENTERSGHYKLLRRASAKAKGEPKQMLPVFCIDEALKL